MDLNSLSLTPWFLALIILIKKNLLWIRFIHESCYLYYIISLNVINYVSHYEDKDNQKVSQMWGWFFVCISVWLPVYRIVELPWFTSCTWMSDSLVKIYGQGISPERPENWCSLIQWFMSSREVDLLYTKTFGLIGH